MLLNQKTLVRQTSSLVNFRNHIKLLAHWLPRGKRTFFIFEGREYSYREVYEQSLKYADFFLSLRKQQVNQGIIGQGERLRIGIYQENSPEYLFASFGAGLSNSILFALNTGFRGETLAKIIDQAKVSLLLTNASTLPQLEKARPNINVPGKDNIIILGTDNITGDNEYLSIEKAAAEFSDEDKRKARDTMPPMDNTSPVLIIYTSGTTGLPKGVPCTHLKLLGAGVVVQSAVHLRKKDRGYICMPLFHSNAWYVGILPIMIAGGSFVLKRKFSASAFEEDILKYGITYMNYVGQPLHYIISALEKKYGAGDGVAAALANHPQNRFRVAYGNGAPAVDRKKIMGYLNMEHVFEIYGSSEAVITTANKPGDPVDSVGQAGKSIIIIDEENNECEPGHVDDNGQLTNYDKAVGEISKKINKDNIRFDGYFDNEDATGSKFRDGFYHSGDLGHIRIVNGKRYLFFNGRTDDWIRKDGENFSAENVLDYAVMMPDVKLAIAYGVPCEVSDEKVMVTVQMREDAIFNPQRVFDWVMEQREKNGMDPKWMPDYIRVIKAFTLTSTQKILIRPFKQEHFDIETRPDMEIYFQQRGDTTYHRLTPEAFEKIKTSFVEMQREGLLKHA